MYAIFARKLWQDLQTNAWLGLLPEKNCVARYVKYTPMWSSKAPEYTNSIVGFSAQWPAVYNGSYRSTVVMRPLPLKSAFYSRIILVTGLKKNQNPSLAFGQPALQFHNACSYFELAQSSVNSGTWHEKFQSDLPIGQVTIEICLPDGKTFQPQTININ